MIRHSPEATAKDPDAALITLAGYATEAAFDWEHGPINLLPTRLVSRADDGRVRWYRKLARRADLPPVVTLAWRAARAEIVVDGHDRLVASLLEGRRPALVSIREVRRRHPLVDDRAHYFAQAEGLADMQLADARSERARDETVVRLAMLPWSRAAYRDAPSASPLSVSRDVWDADIRALARREHRRIPDDLLRS